MDDIMQQWTPEIANECARNHKYIIAGYGRNDSITNVNVYWANRNDEAIRNRQIINPIIFVPFLRIAGTYDGIIQLLIDNRPLNGGLYISSKRFLDDILLRYGYYYMSMNRQNPPYPTNFTHQELDATFVREYQNTKEYEEGRRRNVGQYTKPARR